MKRFKIWLANHYAVPPNIAGITRHFELAREWAKEEDAEVTLFLSKFVHPRRTFITAEEKAQIEQVDGLKLAWLWSFPHKVNDFRRIINMISFAFVFFFATLFRRKPDVFIASSPHLFLAYAGLLVARIKRIPFVFEVRDLWPDSLVKMGGVKKGAVLNALTWMESQLYKKSDQIIVLTEHQRQYISEKGIPLEKIDLIPNGVVVGSWQPDEQKRAEYREKLGVPQDDFVAIYTGAHGPANALEYVVQAGQYLPEKGYSIVLIGDGPDKERLQKRVAELGLKNVHLLDPVPKAEIFDYTNAADFGIISLADNEVFRGARPNKLFDYTFLGKPIITTVDGEVRQIVEQNRVGVFSGAENPKGLAEAIMQMSQYTPDRLTEIKANGREFIDREGDRQKLAKKFFGILKELVTKK
ncbi:glycosyltransferase family 4 protein [Shimazuella alba]|uniref:Glycosyltransferase n=1 Tax=Shimazuella alba TaxID=2690964 RepID=A0A6I4VXQ4_9BACL|nr:glycosyltransferase family 4 protein [Shimazuella alba]MXQ52832.1 glycosyltransferase [Shimazuella alba]